MLDQRRRLGGVVRPYFGGGSAKRAQPPASQHVTAATPASAAIAAPAGDSESPAPKDRHTPAASSAPQKPRPTMREVVREAASHAGWGVLEMGHDLQIDVATAENRSQIVSVRFDHPDHEGEQLTVFSSICGPLHESHAAPLLRYNAKLTYGAFAVERMADREEMVVLRASLPDACRDAAAISRVIAEIAARADKVEGKLTGRDQF